jgi:integrase/recombinase XerD
LSNCSERNTVAHNPVKGVKRLKAYYNEGMTPALSDAQARELLKAPPPDTLKGTQDRAILATLLSHGIRREEFCKLRVRDYQRREDIMHFRIEGKGNKVRIIQLATQTPWFIHEYLKALEHGEDLEGLLFRPVKNNATGQLRKPLNPNSVYDEVVKRYGKDVDITVEVQRRRSLSQPIP